MTHAIARRLVGVSTFGMVNLVAGKPVVKELIPDAPMAEVVTAEVVELLTASARARGRDAQRSGRREDEPGGAGAAARSAGRARGRPRGSENDTLMHDIADHPRRDRGPSLSRPPSNT